MSQSFCDGDLFGTMGRFVWNEGDIEVDDAPEDATDALGDDEEVDPALVAMFAKFDPIGLIQETKALPKKQKCKYCSAQATKRIIHSEGMAYIPVCDSHMSKGKDDAARCTPDGSVDPSNIDGVREIKALDTDPDPSPKKGAAQLHLYWTKGEGAAKIKWGTGGDFKRCVHQLRKYVGVGAEGLCNVYHQSAVGAPPGKGHKADDDWKTDTMSRAQRVADEMKGLSHDGL